LRALPTGASQRYLMVGGYAVMIQTEPRYTKDLDIWIDRKHIKSLQKSRQSK